MIKKKLIILSLFLYAISTVTNAKSSHELIASWVQYTVNGVEVRSVVKGDCPNLTVDGQAVAMLRRAEPTPKHNDTVCSAVLEEGVSTVYVNNIELPVPVNSPKKILIIGDTGCRVSSGHGLYQACNNSSEWPFKRLAKSAASFSPDLIIYTGDYIYREAPCPKGNSGCEKTPYGDNLPTWKADWLLPANPLHTIAPMILTRGNHETCSRAGQGWFRYLDARPYDGECKLNNPPWIADIGHHQVAVMDTANLEDEDGNSLEKRFEKELIDLDARLQKDTWLMTHRPFWGYGGDDDTGELTVQTSTLQEAVKEAGLPELTSLLISAHIHLAEILSFKGNSRPPQLIIGNGGTQLVSDVPPINSIDGVEIKTQRVLNQFGYAIMDKVNVNNWNLTFYDQDGHSLESCRLSKKKVKCK